MAFYLWWQAKSDSPWTLCLESQRDAIIRDKKPELMTVLASDCSFESDMTEAMQNRVKYRGPVYFDFDSQDINESIAGVKAFLTKLREANLYIDSCKIFASGGKGFHIEIPAEVFIQKVPTNGIFFYPRIQREVANALYVETMDLRVYSSKRGRQWRLPNVQRSNKHYKVQITEEELLLMTPENYETITSAPRPLFPTAVATYCPELGLIYAKASDKVSASIKLRSKVSRESILELANYNGEWPETAILVMNGVGIHPAVGFNQIAMQLCILAVALGKSEDQLLSDAQGLIDNHSGDSKRYGSPSKRRYALRDTFRYVYDNSSYKWNLPQFMSILDQQTRASSDLGRGEYTGPATQVLSTGRSEADQMREGDDPPARVPKVVPKSKKPAPTPVHVDDDEDDEKPQPARVYEDAPSEHVDEELRVGAIRVDKWGMYVRSENGWKKMSEVGISNAIRLLDGSSKTENGSALVGYEVKVYVKGKYVGEDVIPLDRFQSKSSLQQWTLKYSCSFAGTDIQASRVSDILRESTSVEESQVWVIRTEGVDLIVPPNATKEHEYEIVWSSHLGVVSPQNNNYRFKPLMDVRGVFKSDLFNAEELGTSNSEFEAIVNLTRFNSPGNVAKLVGWFSAAFLCPIIRKAYGQFPSLQVFGQAGAGKSKSVALLNHLNYNVGTPKELQATGQTPFPVIAAVASSSSIPVVFEEVKPREMTKQMHDFLLNIFRSNYNGHSLSRGALTSVGGAKEVTVNDYMNRCPLVFVGEAIETQTAILERCVLVNLSKADRLSRAEPFNALYKNRRLLGRIGKSLAIGAMSINMDEFVSTFDVIHDKVNANAGSLADGADRPIFNMAVAIMGLTFLSRVAASSFSSDPTRQTAILSAYDNLIASLYTNMRAELPRAIQEISRVLDCMAVISKMPNRPFTLSYGLDYTVDLVNNTMDIKLKPVYAKYVEYMRTISQSPLFDNEQAWITGMIKYGGLVGRDCSDNPVLYSSRLEPLFRLSLEYLENDGVEPFKSE